jgi:hypothetical protein
VVSTAVIGRSGRATLATRATRRARQIAREKAVYSIDMLVQTSAIGGNTFGVTSGDTRQRGSLSRSLDVNRPAEHRQRRFLRCLGQRGMGVDGDAEVF